MGLGTHPGNADCSPPHQHPAGSASDTGLAVNPSPAPAPCSGGILVQLQVLEAVVALAWECQESLLGAGGWGLCEDLRFGSWRVFIVCC